ncbi:PaaX family transcriptional regulator [Microbacterium sp.]|uniref:PaaX family transcriptional regulator n=1 Tax=Microbacterium sp. TaxID=51671 RepID=UPI003342B022
MSTQEIAVSARTLIEGSFGAEGVAPLDTLYDVGLALGLPEQTVRLTIRRMQASGLLRQVGRGRAGHLVRTEEGTRDERAALRLLDFAFAQDRGLARWDGSWRLYAFSIPESQRAERDGLRALLVSLGAAALAPGLYVTPHDLHEELARVVPEATVSERLITAATDALRVPGCADDRAIAERLWPADEVLAACRPLEAAIAALPDPAGIDEIAVTAQALRLSEGLDHALRADPLLPLELRPSPWPPSRVRARFLESWERLEALAPDLPVFAGPDARTVP